VGSIRVAKYSDGVDNSKSATDPTTFDAIVVGSGIAGGWAAKELCDKGLKTLVLERGRNVEHIKDYPTANLAPWQLPHRGQLTRKVVEQSPVMSVIAAEDVQHFFVKDAAVRELALQAYFSSEIGLTRALRYSITPGRYDACVPLQPGQPVWD
jgi:choline dehydrogenase-like flavoprotein